MSSSSRTAVLCARYGSLDARWRTRAEAGGGPAGAWRSIPDGTAHFLEHMLFNRAAERGARAAGEHSDAPRIFDRFAELGADVNAWTTYGHTAYFVEARARFDACLDLLVDFVQAPDFEPHMVDKERAIIEQEIRMAADQAGFRAHARLLRLLYDALYRRGVLDDSFHAAYLGEADHRYLLAAGESLDPEGFLSGVRGAIEDLLLRGVDEATLARLKRKAQGQFLVSLDSAFGLVSGMVQGEAQGVDILRTVDALQNLDARTVTALARRHLDPACMASCRILPAQSSPG